MQDVLIVGIGNTLRSDDGVGARVVEELRCLRLPEEVEILEGVLPQKDPLNLLHVFADRRKVIVIDAVEGGSSPGFIYRLTPEDVEAGLHSTNSVHQMGLMEMLALAKSLGWAPQQVVIIGVEPKSTRWGLDLSPEVAAALPRVVQMVIQEVHRR